MNDLNLGPGAVVLILAYLASTILIGWAGRLASREKTMSDFFLAGRSMGTFVLLMTLFATQYSGNSFIGFPAQAYRTGFAFLYSVTAMQAIIFFYLLYAPALHRVAAREKFITPGDYLLHRFRSPSLHLVSVLVMAFALGNYVLTQMKAMGHLLEGVTRGAVPFAWGVVLLAVIMVLYETLGGMRSVAWTDVLQGGMLFLGALGIILLLHREMGGIGAAAAEVASRLPEKVAVPQGSDLRTWLSTVLLIGAGAAVYPQAIQRIYAARSEGILKRSLGIMIFLPLVTTTFTVFVGIAALHLYPGLEGADSEGAMPRVLAGLLATGPLGYWLVVLVVAATLAAIMSTADSGLLTLSSIVTRDLLQGYLLPGRTEAFYHRSGKLFSWVVTAVLCLLAVATPASIWRLLEIKFEVLIQLFPAFVLGTRSRRLGSLPVLAGLLVGCGASVGLFLADVSKVLGVHAGLVGLACNFLICLAFHLVAPRRTGGRGGAGGVLE